MQHGVRVVMEEPADVQVVDEMGKICKMLVILVVLLFLCVGADGDAAVVFIYSLFCVMILVVVMTFCNAYYQGTSSSSTEEVAASVVAANAAVRGQQSLTGVMLGNDSHATSHASNNNNNSVDAAGIAYGYGDNPRAVRLTLVIESDGRVRLAPMPVEQASAMQPLTATAKVAGGGEHVAGVPLASYPDQPGTTQGNTTTTSNSATATTTRGVNNNNSISDGREGECRVEGLEDGNEMSDDALYGRSAYIPSTGAGNEEMDESVAVPVELSGSQCQGQQQTAQQQEIVITPPTRTEEEEKERVGTSTKVAKDNAEV